MQKICLIIWLCEVGAVLRTPLSFIHSLKNWLIESSYCSESSRHCLSQTIIAWELTFWENVHPHYVSHVRCHMSGVTCQVSHVKKIIKILSSSFFFFFFYKVIEIVSGGFVINGPIPSSFFLSTTWLLILINHWICFHSFIAQCKTQK